MMVSYKFRLYPNREVERRLEEQLEISRWLYNRLLEEMNDSRKEGKKITQKDTQALIVQLKEENPELKKVYSKVLQMVNYQLWSSVKALSKLKKNGKKIGRLRYKKRGRFKILNYNQSGFSIDEKNGRIRLSKVGSIKVKFHRPIEGKVKAVIIKKYPSGKWYAVVQTETDIKDVKQAERSVGIDVGISHFITDSDGLVVENPKHIDKTIEQIKSVQKQLSRKKKGSNNYRKTKKKLAKLHERVKDQRKDYLHKLSRYYADNYSTIYVEDLDIENMLNIHHKTMNRNILDASWSEFVSMLSYKVEGTGRVVKINPAYTSQKCAVCGERVKMPLSKRTFVCPSCGWTADRDYNASLNILNTGSGRPIVPVEEEPLLRHISYMDVVSGQVLSMNQEAPCVSEG